MADIRLAKPAAGTTQTVPSAPDGRFIFDFPADAATLTRNGDDLVLTFEDGAAIQLQGFYTTYSKEEMPSFQVDGVEISGQDFFAALDEDLMPAAGPASGSSAARGGRYNEYGGSDLLDGLDHLGRLDIGFDGGTQLATDTVEPSPYSEVDHGVTVTPSGVGAATEVVTVYEAGLAGGSQAGEKDAPTMAGGSLSINAPDGVASIVIGGVVVFENGALTGKVVSTDEGTLSVTGYDPATGKLDFSYSLDRNTTEHVKSDPDTDTQISHTLVVTVTDTDGDSGSTTITVNVVDDMPEARADSISFTEAAAQEGASGKSVLENDVFGADAPAYKTVTSIEGGALGQPVQGDYGTLTLNEDGTYTYKLGDKVDVPKGETYTEQFTYTIKDADGDTSTATLTIAIKGDEIVPANPGSATIVVDEGALSTTEGASVDGSGQHEGHGWKGTGSFTVDLNGEDGTVALKYGSGPDAPNITVSLINGEDFTSKWLSHNTTLTVNGVTVTVTGATQDDETGKWNIEYSYNLTGQQTHTGQGVGENDPLSDNIDITVTDATGDTSTGLLTVTVHDDGPVVTQKAVGEATDATNDTADSTLSGSFAINFGADGAAENPLSISGATATKDGNKTTFNVAGGSLVVTDNGSGNYNYEYVPANPNESFGSKTFTITATDRDGDSTTVNITVKQDFNPAVEESGVGNNTIVVDEGTQPEHGGETHHAQSGSGSFLVDLHGENGTITVGGFTIAIENGVATASGSAEPVLGVTLSNVHATLEGDKWKVSYDYELSGRQEHGADGSETDMSLEDAFPITVTDATGTTATGSINVAVHDDVPVASDDVNRLAEEAESVSGNVLENDESGADGWRMDGEGNVAAVVLKGSADGTYGTLSLNADGSYTYTRNETGVPDGGASDTFTYIAYDADGDAVEKTLTITIENTEPTTPEGEGHKLTVTLSDAKTAGGNSDTVSQSVDLFDGPEAFTTAVFGSTEGIVVSGGESFRWNQLEADKLVGTGSESGAIVTLTITGITPDGTVTVTATLEDPAHHNDGSNSLDISGIVITATDAGGSTVSGTMNVVVTDDTATGQDDVNRLAEEADSVSGNVLENDESGADGWRMDGEGNVAAVVLKGSADGTYGTLSLNADGSYTYTRNETGVPDGGASDTFTYIAYDADGDAVEKTLTITIENTEPTTPEGEGHKLTVTLSDAKTAGGNSDTVSQSVDLFDGPEAFTTAVFGSTEGIVVSGGESFRWNQLEADKLVGTGSESGAIVTLTITGITPDGTVTVTATLEDPAHHNDGSNSLDISGIVITATDAGGSTVSGTMNVVVTDDGVDVENRAGSSLTVDESYADNVAGPRLELEGSANTDTVSLDVSNLFSVDAGADGEAGREFALSISNKGQTGQKVLVGGSQYDLILRENNDGSISGVAGDENGTVIFNITISNDGNVTLDMTGYGSLVHPHEGSTAQEHDEALSITGVEVTLTVTDTDGDSDSASADLVLIFEDDGPTLTVTTDAEPDAPDTPVNNLGSGEEVSFVPVMPEKPDASDYGGEESDQAYVQALEEYQKKVEAAKNEAKDMAGTSVDPDILSEKGWEGVSIYAGKVTYNAGGTVDQLTRPTDYYLKYSNYASKDDKDAVDWGIMVASSDDNKQDWADDNYETNVIAGNASEAIVIDLGGKLAYGIELSFGAFYSSYKNDETEDVEGAEKLLITFYKGDEIVESRFVDSVEADPSNTGKVTYSTELIAGGFDKVVVSAVLGEDGRESSFTLQGVDFVTAPLAIAVASGELDVASGADGYAEDFAVANVQFAMEQMFTLQADGTYSLSILDGNNASKSAIVTVIIDDLGNSRLTATVDGNELFSATLEKDGDGWSWKMEQYQEFLVQGKDGQLGDLELGFITMDGDDDTATETVNIPLKNLPDLAVSQTTLVTDESYIDVLGSGTKPAEGGDSQANSAKASGTMSVNTYGKEGKLILTIDGEEHQFSLDTGGKLFENQGLTVPTTYGQLTLQNDEAPGTIIYTYTQTKPYNHLSEDGPDQLAENAESFTVKVVDGGGNESGSATITVSIEDDAPVVTVNGDVPASLELTESTETALQTFNASTLFDIKFGADTEGSSTKYELTYREDANSGLKAIVDGKEYDVTLQLEGGILKGTAGGTNIFTVSVAEDTGEVTLAMTGHGTLRHDKTAADDELHLKGVGVKVTVTDGDDDSTTSDSADLTLTITDDVPTISESQKAAIIPSSEEDEDIADFDFNNATKANNAEWVPGWVEGQLPESGNGQVYDHSHEYWGNIEDGYKELALNQGNHTITFSAAVVQYQGSDGNPIEHGDQDDDAPSIKITDITDNITSNEAPLLTFVSTAWNKGESGMAVYSGLRDPKADQSDGEIGAINGQFKDDNTAWEAVKMDLGVDNAYSITITLNSFYNTQGDQEKAYIILMDGDKVVDKLLIEGQDAENGIVDSTKLSSAEAFNTVYIVPWGTKSDFLLNGVEVGYSPVTVLKSEGQVKAVSADDIKGYSFGYDQNDVVTVNEKNLTVSVEDDGKTIHFLSSSSDDDTYTKVIVGEATITEAGKWTLNWFDQETNPQQDTDFTLPIIATDGDDDTAEIKVKVVPSEDEVGDSQAADALPEEEEKQPAAEKREGKDGPQGMMDGALLQSSMAAEAAAPRMAAATLLGMALVADAADDVLAAATGTDGMPHADVKADGLSGDIGDAPSTLHMDGAAQSGADAFDATLDSSLFAPGVMDPLADGTESLEGLLPDKEHAPFDAEGLLFTAAAPDLSDDASGLVGKGVASGDVLPPAGEEGILGTEETDVLHGTDADDILRGGDGDELIFGGSGDDYIDGGEGRDTIYAGDGNDIIVYDKADYLVSGGSGIDFMVSDDSNLTLETLLKGGTDDNEGPIVNSIEVLLKGNDALSLTSLDQLARDYGITLDSKDGKEVLQLDGRWEKQDDGSYDFNGGAEEGGLTLETNLQHDSDASSDNGEMAQQVFILEHTNS